MSTTELAKLAAPVSEKDHMQGSKNATVTLLEYGDYESQDCGHAYQIIKRIQQKLGDRLRFVYRNFPLTEMHDHAMHAAEAAEIADQQGKFWEMHDKLFQNQDELDDKSLVHRAKELNLDIKKFKHDLEYDVFEDMVEEVYMDGLENGVNSVPTFFINDVRYDGDWDYEILLEKLENAS